MRADDLRTGWRTDLILHRVGGQLIERDDCLVIRTPGNPTFYWGNCLITGHPPGDQDLDHWLGRFSEEVASMQPESRHVAIGVDAPLGGRAYPRWRAAGFDVCEYRLLELRPGELLAPARAARGEVALRAVGFGAAFERERDGVIDVEATDAGAFEPEGYRRYLVRQWDRYRVLHDAGLLQWFGLWCEGQLAASCGLIRDRAEPGRVGRFQRVVTHSSWRRRGLCSTLVHRVSSFALGEWKVSALHMVADPADVAIGIYRSLGYRDSTSSFGLQRNAPEDRRA